MAIRKESLESQQISQLMDISQEKDSRQLIRICFEFHYERNERYNSSNTWYSLKEI